MFELELVVNEFFQGDSSEDLNELSGKVIKEGGVSHRYAMMHGRFQPFHLEHLRYFRMAWELSENVLIGITNPDPSSILVDHLSDHRHLPEENPFTFTERLMMIQEALREEGYPMERIFIVPFPIHHPDRWPHYVPHSTVMLVVVYSSWERQKAERFRQAGLEVVVEDALTKTISGRQIRKLLTAGGDWEHLVPPAVARYLVQRKELTKAESETNHQ